ncbi:hypothetical protein ACFU7X_03280 [Streptomyces chartreusis]|uniref:hypothetical protein n=1 Tax=Streptomyces chartreusis TaxID=1969 RepID=UPI0036AF4A7B
MRATLGERREGVSDRRWFASRGGAALAIFLAGSAAASVIGLMTGNLPFFVKENAQAQDAANDEIEAGKAAFDVTVKPALGDAKPWTSWEIDRRLTPAEESELRKIPASIKSADRIWEFVRKAGGRRTDGDANGYRFQFTSERQKTVSITEAYAKVDKCWPSKAKTYISLMQGGLTGWEDVHFDLDSKLSSIPLFQESLQGSQVEMPFDKVIALGGNETAAYLNVLPNSIAQSCNWSLQLEYNVAADPEPKTRTVSKDRKGNEFVFNGPYAADADVWGPSYTGTFGKDTS